MVQKIIKSKLFSFHLKHTRVIAVASKFLFINYEMNIKLTISINIMVVQMNDNNEIIKRTSFPIIFFICT